MYLSEYDRIIRPPIETNQINPSKNPIQIDILIQVQLFGFLLRVGYAAHIKAGLLIMQASKASSKTYSFFCSSKSICLNSL